MNKSRRLWFGGALKGFLAAGTVSLCLALGMGDPGRAQGPAKPASPSVKQGEQAKQVPTAVGSHELTQADLEAFLDGLMPAQLEREDIAGAVVSVVKGGHVLFAKGYGFSDLAKRKAVSPTETLFRPGSISKLFTWTSVMQQVEQGKLNLDQDVNTYLDFKIPPAFGKPITLRNIMTHTAGFEETAKELFVADAQKMRPLDEYLKQHIPGRIFPPGVTPAYSNYATTVAGYIVERVSGKEFSQYVVDNIYGPLGMSHTTFVQPLPADLQPLMSNGYQTASKDAKPFEFVQAYPAGSVSTSAADICNFMIAHLQDGRFGNTQILKAETAQLMHSRQFAADQRLNGMALGFYEETRNGHRIIGHGGDTMYFHSDLHLILDSNVGFFVSYNSAGKGEVSPRTVLFEKFLDRYFPFVPPATPAVATSKEDAQRVGGLYIGSRRGENTFLKLTELFGEPRIVSNSDGTISINPLKGPNGELKKFTETGPLLYREVNGQDQVAFHDNANGRLEFSIDYPFFVFEKAGLADNKHLNLAVLVPSLVLILLAVLYWPIGAAIRWHYGKTLELTPAEKRLRTAVRLVCLIDLACLILWVVFISGVDNIENLSRSRDPFLYFTHFVGLLGALGTLIVLFHAFQSWGKTGRWIWAKLADAGLALACVGFSWFVWHWNLINFNLHY
jgi:CubicO group peptidase (beta-lactamase class C family)